MIHHMEMTTNLSWLRDFQLCPDCWAMDNGRPPVGCAIATTTRQSGASDYTPKGEASGDKGKAAAEAAPREQLNGAPSASAYTAPPAATGYSPIEIQLVTEQECIRELRRCFALAEAMRNIARELYCGVCLRIPPSPENREAVTAGGSVSNHWAGGGSSLQSVLGPAGSSFVVASDSAQFSPGYDTVLPLHDRQAADCNRAKCSPCGEGAQGHDFSELSGAVSKRLCLDSSKTAHRLQQHGEISMTECGSGKTLGHSHDELVASLMAKAEQLTRAAEEEALRRRQLEQQLMMAQQHSEVLWQEVQRARNDALEIVAQLAKNELQCCICTELPIKAKSLSCSHLFCSYCIDQWLQKKNECPICRKYVRASTPSSPLDNYIEKVMEQMPAEKQAERRELVERRRREEELPSAKSSHRQKLSSRSSASTTSSQRSAVVNGASASHQQSLRDHMLAPPRLYLAREESDSDTDSGDGVEYVPGLPGSYYGGFGTCHNCGKRGHWANGCPFK